MELQQLRRQRQSDPGALSSEGCRVLDAMKALEDELELIGRDAAACVVDFHGHFVGGEVH